MNSTRIRNGIIYAVLILAFGAFLYTTLTRQSSTASDALSIGQLASMIRENKVEKLELNNDKITVTDKNGEVHLSRKEEDEPLLNVLANLGITQRQLEQVDISITPPEWWESWGSIAITLAPIILLGIFFFIILRQAQGAGNQAFGFGKSRARMFSGDRPTVTFVDVAGNDEAKQELHEVVEFLKEPEKFAALGARIPKGVLLIGPPGTGKTLMAKAVSGEAGVPFFSISGSEFVEMFVGVGASRVRDLFEQAKKHAPCIIFIDEIDAVGRHRGAGLGGAHDEREQTLNQILVEMDGFDTDTNIIMIAATNRPDILDPALLRPGRFDRHVTMDAPDVKGRRAILDVHVKGKPLAADVDLEIVAKQTPGFAGADIENLVNEAAILAARRNRRSISTSEFQEAIERVNSGPERRSRLLSPKEKEIVAYHEAGHALAMHFLPNADPVHKVTIVPRGMALGYTRPLPDEETSLVTRDKMRDLLATFLGGRVAEEIRFNDITDGATNDLERTTNLARSMVTKLGMSALLGPIRYGEREEMMFLGRQYSERRNYSDKVAQDIDSEVRLLVTEAHSRCTELLQANWEKLEGLVNALLEVETINAPEFEALMRGEDPYVGVRQSQPNRKTTRETRTEDAQREEKRRKDGNIDLGNSLPAPA